MVFELISNQIKKEISYLSTKPFIAILGLTYKCNLRCQMCRLWENEDTSKKELSYREIVQFLNDLYHHFNIRFIRIVDTEAFLRNDIGAIIKSIKRKGFYLHIVTNGTLITRKLAELCIREGVDRISISLDAPNSVHDNIRGLHGAFERIKKGIELLVEVKKEKKHAQTKIHVLGLISALNYTVVPDMITFHKKMQTDEISFSYLSEVTPSAYEKTIVHGKIIASNRFLPIKNSLLLNRRQVKEFRKSILAINLPSLKILNNLKDEYLVKGYFPVQRCYHTKNAIMLNPYGDIIPCANLIDYSYGNIKKERISNIWNNEKHRFLLKKLNQSLFPVCYSCCHFPDNFTLIQYLRILLNLGL